MTHKEHDGYIWNEINRFTGEGEYIKPSDYEDKPNIIRHCPKCKKNREFEYEPNPQDERYHCIICDTIIDMRKKENRKEINQGNQE